MTVIVQNFGQMDRKKNTKGFGAVQGDQGTVRVEYQGQQFVFGPNEKKSFSDNGIAAAVVAADGRLRVATTDDGIAQMGGNASVAFNKF